MRHFLCYCLFILGLCYFPLSYATTNPLAFQLYQNAYFSIELPPHMHNVPIKHNMTIYSKRLKRHLPIHLYQFLAMDQTHKTGMGMTISFAEFNNTSVHLNHPLLQGHSYANIHGLTYHVFAHALPKKHGALLIYNAKDRQGVYTVEAVIIHVDHQQLVHDVHQLVASIHTLQFHHLQS